MNIKYFINFCQALFCLAILLPSANAAGGKLTSSSFDSMIVYYAQSNVVPFIALEYHITLSTPQGVAYGVYKATFVQGQHKGDTIPLVSWTGKGSAPVLTINDWDSRVDDSHCTGMDSSKGWLCASQTFNVRVESDNYGCPWVAGVNIISTSSLVGSYSGPVTRGTVCPTVPVSTYDISWDPGVVKHDTVLAIKPTNGTVTSTLKTYLMESGSLCDKSKNDARGAYCRFVGTGITLSVLGCDNGKVKTTVSAHALTDKELHDINVSVDTRNIGTGTVQSTCNFQYLLEQL